MYYMGVNLKGIERRKREIYIYMYWYINCVVTYGTHLNINETIHA
jgi:hypothetical protein